MICASVDAPGTSENASENSDDAGEESRKGLLRFTKLDLKRREVVLEEDAWMDIPASKQHKRKFP